MNWHSGTREERARRYARVAELTREGWSLKAIAEELGTTERTVIRARAATGTTTRANRPPLTPEQLARAQALLEDGANYDEVARSVGCGDTVLRNRFPGYGWSARECGLLRAARRRAERAGLVP